MYKKAISGLMLLNLMLLAGYFCVTGIQADRAIPQEPAFQIKLDASITADARTSTIGMVSMAASGQRVVDYGVLEKELAYELDEKDYETLLRIVESEAGGEDEDGRLLVANVVLNRVNSERFPNTVTEVVFQREKGVSQFSPAGSGRIWSVQISEQTVKAVQRALEGEDISQGALYFAARKYAASDRMRWFDEHLTFLFKHGGHEFFF